MSLKEKAKTDDLEIAVQLERILRQHSVEDADAFDRFYERLKIAESKLEDAQKEIDKIEEATKWLQANYEESIKNERLELKQKLWELWNQRPLPKDFDTGVRDELDPTCTKLNMYGYIEANEKWRKKFDELLKEEREAKTT
jgi:hypothetical protein